MSPNIVSSTTNFYIVTVEAILTPSASLAGAVRPDVSRNIVTPSYNIDWHLAIFGFLVLKMPDGSARRLLYHAHDYIIYRFLIAATEAAFIRT